MRTVTNDSRGSSTDVTQTDTVVLDRSHPRKVKPVKSFDGDRGPVSIHMLEGHKTEVCIPCSSHTLLLKSLWCCDFYRSLSVHGILFSLVYWRQGKHIYTCRLFSSHLRVRSNRSKDTVVQLWDVPLSPQNLVPPNSRRTIVHMRQNEQGDLTSLDWNHDGTLLAIGSYDSMLRVCKPTGEIDFALSQHEVSSWFIIAHYSH